MTEETSAEELHLFEVCEDFYGAASESDAWDQWEQTTGESRRDYAEGDCYQVADDRAFRLMVDKNGEVGEECDHVVVKTMTAAEIVARWGRGLHFSENY